MILFPVTLPPTTAPTFRVDLDQLRRPSGGPHARVVEAPAAVMPSAPTREGPNEDPPAPATRPLVLAPRSPRPGSVSNATVRMPRGSR